MEQFIIFVVVVVVGLIVKAVNKSASQGRQRNPGTPSPRVQKLIERIQAQQGLNQPIQFQGQFTQPTSGPPAVVPGQVINSAGQVINSAGQVVRPTGPVQDPGRAQASAQMSGMLQQLMQAGQTAGRFGQQITGPGQYPQQPGSGQQYPGPPTGYAPAGQFQPAQPPPARRPQQNKGDLDTRIRALMSTGNEVSAVRLICDEKDLGIIDAQKYARSLVAGPAKAASTTALAAGRSNSEATQRDDAESRYVGSAAFAESVFNTRDDDNVWASGWVDKPEVDDRTDIDELWQTVQNAGRPKPPPKS